ncbi:MAG: hypothetical protein AB7I27_03130 [Bacteriovoracaceae bacterium]
MKKSVFAIVLAASFSAFALEPVSDSQLSAESALMECKPGERVEREVVGQYCVFRDPQTSTCMMWENLYRERCVPESESAK